MIWTATPEGLVNYWSQRWYDYTGLDAATTLGGGWTVPFHDDDMPDTIRRWQHSLATGEPYSTEYRCRSVHGEWRWMLGRALPLRDHKTGNILRWFGTCTDIQDIIDAKATSHRHRQQLLDVLKHSQMTMWIIDREWKVTFYEGDYVMGSTHGKIIGGQILDIVGPILSATAIDKFKETLDRLLSGAIDLEVLENEADGRWFRSKMMPLKGKTGPNGVEDDEYISGVVVIGSDVTGLRQKEQDHIKALANETAAEEASKMKSSFLAVSSSPPKMPAASPEETSSLVVLKAV